MIPLPPKCKDCDESQHFRKCPLCSDNITCQEAFDAAHGQCRWWVPNPGPQTEFLASDATEVLYGGAAGGGKSAALVVIPTRWIHIPRLKVIGFRRETTDLDDLIDKADAVYRGSYPDVVYNKTTRTWRWPNGSRVRLTHLQNEGDEKSHQGQEYQIVIFDELTHFHEKMYKFLRGRIRSARAGMPGILRCTSNPGGVGGEWVFTHWGPWLDPEWAPCHRYLPTRANGDPLECRATLDGKRLPPAEPGEVLWTLDGRDGTEYVPRGTTRPVILPNGRTVTQHASARQFIPALLTDNPKLVRNDPAYIQKLMGHDALTRAQMVDGNWLAKALPGLLFKRHWCELVDEAPRDAYRLRFWDRASTVAEKGKDPDWTVGLLYATRGDGIYYVENMVDLRGTPAEVESLIIQCAETDVEASGRRYTVCLAQDPAQAGQADVDHYVAHPKLRTFDVKPERESGDKTTRFLPFSAQCEHGNVKVVRGPWNARLFDWLEGFPGASHDDHADGCSGAHNAIIKLMPSRIRNPAGNAGTSRWESPGRGF